MKKSLKYNKILKIKSKELFKINKIKKLLVHLRKWTKIAIIFGIAGFLGAGTVSFAYRPIYSVTLNGQMVGYTEDKSGLQEKINNYIEKGNGENVAFVEINELPQYHLCLLKKDITTNDEEIYQKVISAGVPYYKYFAIAVDKEEKVYVSSFEEAEQVVNKLKEKDSNNKDKLSIIEKYNTSLESFKTVEQCVSDLYVKKVVPIVMNSAVAASGMNTSNQKVELGISLIRPVSGVITSRFGARWGRTHKGIDIGASQGTTIVAAASGTVTVSQYGYSGGYGNYVMLSHGNGIETLYGHCTSLLVTVGEQVAQGQPIATVGSTGNSTGPHLHLEIRVNGIAQDPQNYVY